MLLICYEGAAVLKLNRMPDDTVPLPAPQSELRSWLKESGAKPHSRMSELSRYMIDHHDELLTLVSVEGYAWADIAAVLATKAGLTDETGKPVNAVSAKLAWSRLRRRTGKTSASRSRPMTGAAMAAVADDGPAIAEALSSPVAPSGMAAPAIRPAQLRERAASEAPTSSPPFPTPFARQDEQPAEAPFAEPTSGSLSIKIIDDIFVSDENLAVPFASPAGPPMTIQPARPRRKGLPETPSQSNQGLGSLPPRDIDQQLDELARRQSAKKIPPPDVL